MDAFSAIIRIPTGPLFIKSDSHHILEISHVPSGKRKNHRPLPPPIEECVRQIEEYFCHQRKTFHLNMKIVGTPFQKKVWNALQDIPLGEVVSYSQLASIVGSPRACRAVGSANNANPFSIVIPCHRVIGKGMELVGYRGGLDKKSLLLKHEGFRIKNSKVWKH